MSLKYIIAQVAAECGIDVTNATQRAFLIDRINQGAKEMHESRDLVNCEREQLFSLDNTQQVVALPYYVGQVRALRNYNNRRKIEVQDLRPRYKTGGWAENRISWREKGKFPLKRNILNEAPVTLTIPQAESAPFSVVISGSTPNSERVTEIIVFAAGDVSKTSVNAFSDIFAFENVAAHTYNVTMTDIEGNELSILPNTADKVQYIWVQVLDHQNTTAENPYMVEVLYKIAFMPMRNDYDEFVCPDYDDAIVWQVIGNIKAKSKPDQSVLAFAKVKKLLGEKENDKEAGKEKEVDFAENQTLSIFNRVAPSSVFPSSYYD